MRAGWWVALGRAVYRWVVVFTSLVLAAPLAAQPNTSSLRAANGLIVKFKDAPAHEVAHATRTGPQRTLAEDEVERAQRVLADSGLNGVRLRPAGRAAQRLDFGHVLNGAEAARMAEQLRRRPEVEWVFANERERRLQVPTPVDPLFGAQWWLHPMSGSDGLPISQRLRGVPGFQTAWLAEEGKAATVVAVLDTGITLHPDLDANVLQGYDFVADVAFAGDGDGRDPSPSDPGDFVTQGEKDANPVLFAECDVQPKSSWHGTNVAGIVAAVTNNTPPLGVASASWNGRVLPVRVAAKCGADVGDIVDGMRWAAGLQLFDSKGVALPRNLNPARIVNISFGGDPSCNANDPDAQKAATARLYLDTISELAGLGVAVVAAAGNEHGAVSRPASCQGVIGVAALNRDGFKTTYSNFGTNVVISTVGGDDKSDGAWGSLLFDDGLVTLDNDGQQAPGGPGYASLFGTSFAAPVVAGVVSLMLSANPNLTVAQVIDGLRRSARPHVSSTRIGACSSQNPGRCNCSTSTCGAGILDAAEAVRFAQDTLAGRVFTPKNWPTEILDSVEVRQAVALGPDLPPNPVPPAASSGGGGAVSVSWVFALALAVVGLGWASRRRRGD